MLPSYSNAKFSSSFGQGLYKGTAGKEHVFTIQPNDVFGNVRGWPRSTIADDRRHLDQFYATAELVGNENPGLFVPVSITYDDDSTTYKASYKPRASGSYQLNVTLREEGKTESSHIFGSPFFIQTQPGATFAQQSFADGGFGNCLPWISSPCSGLYHGMAGETSTFTIHAYDFNRNRRVSGGDKWDVSVSSSVYDYNFGTVQDLLNGSYSVSITPHVSGINELTIALDGTPLQSSPFYMDVAHNEVVGPSSFVVIENDIQEMTAMTENTVLVQAADAYGNDAIYCGDIPYSTLVDVEGEGIDVEKTSITQLGSGRYLINVTPLEAGAINLTIKMNGAHIRNSPFNITSHPGIFSGSFSSASGFGLYRAKAGEEATFIIQSKDSGGNNKVKDDASFVVELQLVERTPPPVGFTADLEFDDEKVIGEGTVEYSRDGQYVVKYNVTASGVYLIHVRDDKGDDISGSPFTVNVSPSTMSAKHCIIDGDEEGVAGSLTLLRVYARDRFGNFVSNTVELVEMTLALQSRHQSQWETDETMLAQAVGNPVGGVVKVQHARDDGRGIFHLNYIPQYAGSYSVDFITYSPGALVGSFYSTTDLSPDYLITSMLDEDVEMHWGNDTCGNKDTCSLIDTASGSSRFGASWNGRIRAEHDEEYTIGVECAEGGFASLAIDGHYVPWRSCDPLMTTNVILPSNKGVDFALRYRHEDGDNAFVVLKWSSPSTGSFVKIPRGNLYHQLDVGNGTLHQVIYPGSVYAPTSLAIGKALSIATSGVNQSFHVETRDSHGHGEFGNLLLSGGLSVSAHGFSFNEEEPLDATVVDNKNGTYTVNYNPGVSGLYFLFVNIYSSPVHGTSPYLLNVKPGETNPDETIILSDSGEVEGVAGRELMLQVQARDVNRNNRDEGGDTFRAVLEPSSVDGSNEEHHCKVDYDGGGIYSLVCSAMPKAGDYQLHIDVLIDEEWLSIKSSPFNGTIHPGYAIPETTTVTSGCIAISDESGESSIAFESHAGLYSNFVVSVWCC